MPPNTPENWVHALRHAVRGGTPDFYGDRFLTQLFILGSSGDPVEELVPDVHQDFLTGWFKRFVLRTDLPDQDTHVWTCFCPWDTPVFLTHLIAPSVDKIFTSANWAEAQDKHQRVAEKAKRVLPRVTK